MTGSDPADDRIGVDRTTPGSEGPSAYLKSTGAPPTGFGTITQSIAASGYAGQRVRLRASVRSEDVSNRAGLWMRINRGTTITSFDNMQKRPITGSQGWTTCDVVLDVPSDAAEISFGALLSGPGELWLRQVKFEAVGADVPTTVATGKVGLPTQPVNLGFDK